MKDDLEWEGPFEDERADSDEPELAEEPLFTALLRRAVRRLDPDDVVLRDVVEHLASPISVHLAKKLAKGGRFAEEKEAAGADVERYRRDQSLRAHLFNGLLPVIHLADRLKLWEAPQFRRWDEEARRLFVAGYCLHDWIKLPGIQEELGAAGLTHDPNPNLHLPIIEEAFRRWSHLLGIAGFLAPVGGVEPWLHDLIYIAANTQVKWGTMRNRSALPRLQLDGRRLELVVTLSRLGDLLAYSSFTPVELAHHPQIRTLVWTLSDDSARLTFHHLSENRGILTNLIHNAALEALTDEARVPLLYAPSGVVYLERRDDAPPLPPVEEIARLAIEKTREVCAFQVRNRLPGFKSSPTGFRFPDFYWLFFDLPGFLEITPRATLRAIPFSKSPRCGGRFTKAAERGFLPASIDVETLPATTRVDQLAEILQLWERELGGNPGRPVLTWLFELLQIEPFREDFDQIVTGGATGGVAYNWYVAAAVAARQQPGLSDAEWEAWLEELATQLATRVRAEENAASPDEERWAPLFTYVTQTLHLDYSLELSPVDFGSELAQYAAAKRRGRGTTNVCSLCASTFPIETQQESAVLFAPAVYSNRLQLHGGATQRHICAVCSLEMMLRQLLMNHTATSGGRFESRKVRYLFFYPTYFFTPETLDVLRDLHERLRKMSITGLRKLVTGTDGDQADVRLDVDTLQRVEDLLLAVRPAQEQEYDPLTRMHFPRQEPMAFSFIGIPAGRDPSDTEAWIQPSLLALLLPLLLDVKVVASESPLPLFTEAGELPETTFLDGVVPAIRRLTKQELLTLDDISAGEKGAIQRLLAGFFIHTDAHAGMGRGGFDYRWQQFPAVARDLAASPLYVFHYLKKWQRAQEGVDGLPGNKVQQYLNYYTYFDPEGEQNGGASMSHAQELTRLYRQFYRAEGFKSNAILRPISVAAAAILNADPRLFNDADALEEAVWGDVQGFVNRVRSGSAQGLSAPGIKFPDADVAVRDFARYFVQKVFREALMNDTSALRGRQLNLLKNACEVLYLDAERKDRAARKGTTTGSDDGDPTDSEI
jgi:CRISPR-associated protein Csc3